jgi:hypothetical protein
MPAGKHYPGRALMPIPIARVFNTKPVPKATPEAKKVISFYGVYIKIGFY